MGTPVKVGEAKGALDKSKSITPCFRLKKLLSTSRTVNANPFAATAGAPKYSCCNPNVTIIISEADILYSLIAAKIN